ncbi:MAG: RNA polymerase sigma factor [Aminipila sp.]
MIFNNKGKKHLFENNIAIYYKDIYRFLRVLTGDRTTAEDLSQNVMEKAWKYINSLKDVNKAKSWLFRIARNEAKTYYKKTCRRETYEMVSPDIKEEWSGETEKDILDYLVKTEENHILMEALKKLEKKYSQIIILRYVSGLEIKEIAYILDINYNTARTNLHRGLHLLKELYLDLTGSEERESL